MTSASTRGTRALAAAAGFAAVALVLTGCAAGGSSGGSAGGVLTIGTTDKITTLDPAGSYDNGSFAVMNQVFPFLMNTPYGSPDVEPDIAESASFTSPTDYTVKLKEGLKWANGHALTSSDVKFSFDRQLKIADVNGPSSLLANLDSVAAPDDVTVVFTLKSENDQTFPQVLSSPAGPIVDEEAFSADALTPDSDIVSADAFAGQYTITNYDLNNLIQYKAYPDYKGLLGPAKTGTVNVKYYADSSNLKLDIQEGNIDVAFRSLSATDIEDLRGNDKVKVVDGPGGEIRYIVFNFDTQPYGATTAEADAGKALAVRQAVADLINRDEIAKQVYKGTYTPLYSYVPAGLTGAVEPLKSLYGDGNGAPDTEKAKATLEAAGVTTPITLNLQYSNDHYGPSSGDEYALIKDQLESSGLFTVNLQTTEWVQYSKDRSSDVYPAYQLGWFPDYSDADNYLSPFFVKKNFLANHFDDAEVQGLIAQQVSTTDASARTAIIEQIQEKVAEQLSTVPYLQGSQVAVVGSAVSGAESTLDASFKFRYAALSKS
ncbi:MULTISPECIES: ABC transporter substrate-binding protein [unclassified Rathayibacter]|uniref:ABC transporter substrate-binding protein n=1 Tax=unclassified Rathayibacter TaxID=2609250 RepID=UPI00188D6425|nr:MULTISPECIES: ABC transporter substrate-binding protein [unclassified Rathayibacter]MBF4462070.1 peptide ABC transporter substrate-binding protein [Rathayibacter sp. VKM Ac-2879]MBF4503887.1 peptide ABC transporter substrate-binding protein [Rathayibacter sp. VKM Ac-2878]